MTTPSDSRRPLLDHFLFRLLAAAWLVIITATYLRLLFTRILVMHGFELSP